MKWNGPSCALPLLAAALIACQSLPGDPGRFDAVGSARSVAEAVGLSENAALISIEAAGTFRNGTLDIGRPETKVHYVFGDSSGTRYSLVLRGRSFDVESSRAAPSDFDWQDDPDCNTASVWRKLREEEASLPSKGVLKFGKGELTFTLPGADGSTWVARSRGFCAQPDLAHEREFRGCYQTVRTYRGHVPMYSTFYESTRQFGVPDFAVLPPALRRAVDEQRPAELRPEPSWRDPDVETWTVVRGRGRFRGETLSEFLAIDEARPAPRELCLRAASAP